MALFWVFTLLVYKVVYNKQVKWLVKIVVKIGVLDTLNVDYWCFTCTQYFVHRLYIVLSIKLW